MHNILSTVVKKQKVPFLMPGHKGRFQDHWSFDLTGTQETEESINQILLKTKELFKSRHSFFSLTGGTGAMMGAMMSLARPSQNILIERTSHLSVYRSICLLGLDPVYFYSDEDLPDGTFDLAVTISPTLFGSIPEADFLPRLKEKASVILADEAHGAHLPFIAPQLSSVGQADLVMHSFHKTLTALTQTAALHIFSDKISLPCLQFGTNFFQSTTPSFLLMDSIDQMLDDLRLKGQKSFQMLSQAIKQFEDSLKDTPFHLAKFGSRQDPHRLVLQAEHCVDYKDLKLQLESMGIYPEFACGLGLVLMPTIYNTESDFKSLLDALSKVTLKSKPAMEEIRLRPKKALKPSDAYREDYSYVAIKEAIGKISAKFITMYPPAAPVILPGEMIPPELIDLMNNFQGSIHGIENGKIAVLNI